MVVFLDLDEDDVSDPDPHADPTIPAGYGFPLRHQVLKSQNVPVDVHVEEVHENNNNGNFNPNVNSLSAALGCYPYLSQNHSMNYFLHH